MPYIPAIFHPENDQTVPLLMRQGQIAADRADRNGAMWANLASQLGRIGSDYMQQRQQAPFLAAKLQAEQQQNQLTAQDIAQKTRQNAQANQEQDAYTSVGQLGNPDGLQSVMAKLQGNPQAQMRAMQLADQLRTTHKKMLGDAAEIMVEGGFDPTIMQATGKELISLGMDPNVVSHYGDVIGSLSTQPGVGQPGNNLVGPPNPADMGQEQANAAKRQQAQALITGWLKNSPDPRHNAMVAPHKIGFLPEGATPIDEVTGQPIPGAPVVPKQLSNDEQALFSYAKSLNKGVQDLTPQEMSTFTQKQAQDKKVVDPAAQALLAVTLQEKQRKAAEDAAPLGVGDNPRTTMDGRSFVDLGEFKGKELKATAEARAAGLPALQSKDAAAVRQIDSAKQNVQNILSQIEDVLPKDPSGRLVVAPENALKKFFQSDAEIAAFDSNVRNNAIPAIQALASGGTGNRIQKVEVDNMIGALPRTSDTAAVARQKTQNLIRTLQGLQDGYLVRDRSKASGSPAAPTPKAAPQPGERRMFGNQVGVWDGKNWVSQN